MQPEQKLTYMEHKKTGRKIRISTIYLSHDPELHLHPDSMWETMVFTGFEGGKTLAFFPEEYPFKSGYGFYDIQIRGRDRNLQHAYTVKLAQKRHYRIVKDQDNLEEWDKKLEGLPNLDFTPEELRKLEFYRWLRNQGRL